MTESWSGTLVLAVGGAITSAALSWAFKRRAPAGEPEGDAVRMGYPPRVRVAVWASALVLAVLFAAVLPFVGVPADDRLLVGGVVAALELLVGLLLIEIGGAACEAGQTGLLVTTPWRGRRFLPWAEIRQIRFDASAQAWRLRSSTGDAAAIPAFFTGLAAFAALVLEHAPAEAIDREPGTRARLLGLADAPI